MHFACSEVRSLKAVARRLTATAAVSNLLVPPGLLARARRAKSRDTCARDLVNRSFAAHPHAACSLLPACWFVCMVLPRKKPRDTCTRSLAAHNALTRDLPPPLCSPACPSLQPELDVPEALWKSAIEAMFSILRLKKIDQNRRSGGPKSPFWGHVTGFLTLSEIVHGIFLGGNV